MISAVHTYLLILVGILYIAILFISCYNLDLLSLFQNTLLGFSLFGLKEIGEYRLSEQREHPNEWSIARACRGWRAGAVIATSQLRCNIGSKHNNGRV